MFIECKVWHKNGVKINKDNLSTVRSCGFNITQVLVTGYIREGEFAGKHLTKPGGCLWCPLRVMIKC